MRRSSGIATITAAAVLGVGAALAVAETAPRAPIADASTQVAGDSPPSSGTTSQTSPTATPTDPVAPGSGHTDSQLGAGNLLQKVDFATVGWDTSHLTVQIDPTNARGLVGLCSNGALNDLDGDNQSYQGDYRGVYTSAQQVGAAFLTEQAAAAAYATVHGWIAQCRANAEANPDVTVGPDVPVDLGAEHGQGLWVSIPARDGGAGGAMGVLVVGRRVAVVQIYDPDPKPSTVDALMVLATRRLSWALSG